MIVMMKKIVNNGKKILALILVFIISLCLLGIETHSYALVSPKAQDGFYTWKIDKKEVVSDTYYGTYKTIGSATVGKRDAPQDVKVSGSTTFKHLISGSVKVSYSILESSVGFKTSFSENAKVSLTKKNAKAGTYLLQIRGVYKRYKIKQQKYLHIDGAMYKSGNPIYCYVNKFKYKDYRLTKK